MMIKVFIIDDAVLVRTAIKKILAPYSDIVVIGEAENPVDAFDVFKKVGLPDVFLLDIEMPKMDGLTFLKKIQQENPIPTIICSSLVEAGSSKAIESLRLGACDIILKPKIGLHNSIDEVSDEFATKIYAAAKSHSMPQHSLDLASVETMNDTNKVVFIGVSTGGVQTLEQVFRKLRKNHPPILVVQHMPAGFTTSFAKSLDGICKNSIVKESKDGDKVKNGVIYIAPGDKHMEISKDPSNRYIIILKDYPKVSGHKPSVDVLFNSAAKVTKNHSVAFILTGMGKDGVSGIKQIKECGGKTYAQDEATSIVYGMPKIAFEVGAVNKQVSLDEVAAVINLLK